MKSESMIAMKIKTILFLPIMCYLFFVSYDFILLFFSVTNAIDSLAVRSKGSHTSYSLIT